MNPPPGEGNQPAQAGPTETFWAGLSDGQFRFQSCSACSRAFHRPRLICPACGSTAWEWLVSEGRGSVYSCTTVHRPGPAFRQEAPFCLALVDLDEGFRAMGRIRDGEARIGDRVVLVADLDHEGQARIGFEIEAGAA